MSSEEFPAVPTRPQKHAGSSSPTPTVPARPGFKLPSESLPQVPFKRPTRLKTAELDELVRNTDEQLNEMQGLITKRSSDNRNQFQELKTQEDKLQSGIEELFGQPGSNAKEQEMQEEKERLINRRKAILEERKRQQLARDDELKMLEKRREELVRERQREEELEKKAREALKSQEEEELQREKETQRERELGRERELQMQKEAEKKRQREIELERKRELELAKQRELELQEKKQQQEMEKRQAEELQAKKRESESLERERRVTEEKALKLQERKRQIEGQNHSQSQTTSSDADVAFLETVGTDFGLKADEPDALPRMPERPTKLSTGSKGPDTKSDVFEKSTTSTAGQFANQIEAEKMIDLEGSSHNKFEPFAIPNVPERPFVSGRKSSSESPILPNRRQSAGEGRSQSPCIPERPGFGNKKSSIDQPVVPDKRPEVIGRKAESPTVPERSIIFGRNSSSESPVVPEKRPDSRDKKSESATVSQSSAGEQGSSSGFPVVPDRRPDHGSNATTESVSPDFPPVPDRRPDFNVKKSDSPVGTGQDDNEKKNVSSASNEKETDVLETSEFGEKNPGPPLEPERQTPGPMAAHEESKSDVEETELPKVDNKEAKLEVSKPDGEQFQPLSITDQKLQESSSEVGSNETAKKKLPPVPKKPSSRIFAFQEMLKKQQMEEAQSSHRKPFEPSVAESNNSSEPSRQRSVPQRPNRAPASEERSKFANNLNGLFALPGMSPLGGGFPSSLAKKLGPLSAEEENKETASIPSVRQPRARGPRGRKLPSNVASVKKVSSESKTNEIEIFSTWRTVVLKREESPNVNSQDSSQKSLGLGESIESSELEQAELDPVDVSDPTPFGLDDQKSVKPLEPPGKPDKYDSFLNAHEHNSSPDDKKEMKISSFFSSTTEPAPMTTFAFQDTPEDTPNSSSVDLTPSAKGSGEAQPHDTSSGYHGPPANSDWSSELSEKF